MKEGTPVTKSSPRNVSNRSLESLVGPRLVAKPNRIDSSETSRPKPMAQKRFTEVVIGPKMPIKRAKPISVFTAEKQKTQIKIELKKEVMRTKSPFNLEPREKNQAIRLAQSQSKDKVQYINRQQLLNTPKEEVKENIQETNKKYKPVSEGRKRSRKRRRQRRRSEAYARKTNRITEAIAPVPELRNNQVDLMPANKVEATPTKQAEIPTENLQIKVSKIRSEVGQIEKTYRALKTAAQSNSIQTATYTRLRESILMQVEETKKTVATLKEEKTSIKKKKNQTTTEVPAHILKEFQLNDIITTLNETPKVLLKQRITILMHSLSTEQIESVMQRLTERNQLELVHELDTSIQKKMGDSANPPIDEEEQRKVKRDERPERESKKDEVQEEEEVNIKKESVQQGAKLKRMNPRMIWVVQNQEVVNQRRKKIMMEKYKQEKQKGSTKINGKDIAPPVPSPSEIASQINPANDGSLVAITATLNNYANILDEREAENVANRMIRIFPAGEITTTPTDRILTNPEIAVIRNKEEFKQAA